MHPEKTGQDAIFFREIITTLHRDRRHTFNLGLVVMVVRMGAMAMQMQMTAPVAVRLVHIVLSRSVKVDALQLFG